MKQFISWRRVSTKMQGHSGLGLESQTAIIKNHVGNNELIADYHEVYTGKDLKGCKELQKAIAHCKASGATLIIAKTDRFRNAYEALGIVRELPNQIKFCDVPDLSDQMLVLFLPTFFGIAEVEAFNVSARTKAAFKAMRARGETWYNNYGKYTGTTREESLAKARVVSSKVRTDSAITNPTNVVFWSYSNQFKAAHGLDTSESWIKLSEALNKAGITTASGLEFNSNRTRAMYAKCKRLYA